MTKITLVKGDITTQEVDAIVNAANGSLRGGGGVDGAIHRAAGPGLYEECAGLRGCETGDSKLTQGYNLPAKYIIHTVGPRYGYENGQEADLLRSCYLTALTLAEEHSVRTIAFPAISTGIFSYPVAEATRIAVETIKNYLEENPTTFEEIRFIAFDQETYHTYAFLLSEAS